MHNQDKVGKEKMTISRQKNKIGLFCMVYQRAKNLHFSSKRLFFSYCFLSSILHLRIDTLDLLPLRSTQSSVVEQTQRFSEKSCSCYLKLLYSTIFFICLLIFSTTLILSVPIKICKLNIHIEIISITAFYDQKVFY